MLLKKNLKHIKKIKTDPADFISLFQDLKYVIQLQISVSLMYLIVKVQKAAWELGSSKSDSEGGLTQEASLRYLP